MGTHGRWRKEQHAEAEVCGQERGVLACLLRCSKAHEDEQLGRHQRGGVGLDHHRGDEAFTPAQGVTSQPMSIKCLQVGSGVAEHARTAQCAMIHDVRGLRAVGLHTDLSP